MPTRAHYPMNAAYVAKSQAVFGQPPDKPLFELFIPEEFRTTELVHAIQAPLWRLETDVIWPRLAELLRHDGVSGDFVEFGVYSGGSLCRMVEVLRPANMIGRFYGFDSFQGMPKVDSFSRFPSYWHEGAFADTSKEQVLRYLTSRLGHVDDVELVEGWFSESIPTVRDRITSVAFARVDCDLYSSTVDVFDFLAGRLVDGAIVYFDDWTHDASSGETKAFFEFAEREASRYTFQRLFTVSEGAMVVRVKMARHAANAK